jgi:type IV pilus assembly protein PilA
MRKVPTGFTLIAIPNFTKFRARSKQSEVKSNLKAMFVAQKAFRLEKDRYSSLVGEIGFSPERNNRYAYYLISGGTLEDRSASALAPGTADNGISVDTFKYSDAETDPATWPTSCGQTPAVSDGPPATFVAGAAGDIDADDTIDHWTISDQARSLAGSGGGSGGHGHRHRPGGTTTTSTVPCSADRENPPGEPANDTNDVDL